MTLFKENTFHNWLKENHPETLDEGWGKKALLGLGAAGAMTGAYHFSTKNNNTTQQQDQPVKQQQVQQQDQPVKQQQNVSQGEIEDMGDYYLVTGSAEMGGKTSRDKQIGRERARISALSLYAEKFGGEVTVKGATVENEGIQGNKYYVQMKIPKNDNENGKIPKNGGNGKIPNRKWVDDN